MGNASSKRRQQSNGSIAPLTRPSTITSNASTSPFTETFQPPTSPTTPTFPSSAHCRADSDRGDNAIEISTPAPPRPLTRLSTCIDPVEITKSQTPEALQESTVRSPSGNLLGLSSYFDRPDRPLCMRERRERILRALAAEPLGDGGAKKEAGDVPMNEVSEKGGGGGRAWCCRGRRK